MSRWLIVICSFPLLLSFTQRAEYRTGDTLYAWSIQGLEMRASADVHAPIVGIIPYGAQLKIVDPFLLNQEAVTLALFAIDTLTNTRWKAEKNHWKNQNLYIPIQSSWVKIAYQGKEGFVLDGYLSRLPGFEIATSDPSIQSIESFDTYLHRVFGQLGHEEESNRPFQYSRMKVQHANPFLGNSKGSLVKDQFLFSNITRKEGILLANALIFLPCAENPYYKMKDQLRLPQEQIQFPIKLDLGKEEIQLEWIGYLFSMTFVESGC